MTFTCKGKNSYRDKRASFCSIAPSIPVKNLPNRATSLQHNQNRRYFRPSLGTLQEYLAGKYKSENKLVENYLEQIRRDVSRVIDKVSDEILGYELLSFNEFSNLRKELDILSLRKVRMEAAIACLSGNPMMNQEIYFDYMKKALEYSERVNCLQRLISENVSAMLFQSLSVKRHDDDLRSDNARLKEKCVILSEEIERLKQQINNQGTELVLFDESHDELVKRVSERDEEIQELKKALEQKDIHQKLVLEQLKKELIEHKMLIFEKDDQVQRLRDELESEHTKHLEETGKIIEMFNRDLDLLQISDEVS